VVWLGLVFCSANAERLYGLERMERFDLLPRLLSGTQVRQVSSYDRSGGNDDGFNGTYSYLYVDENSEYVLFDETGAGCLYRFWMTYGSLPADYSDYRLRFYFDNESEPRLNLSIAEFFDGAGAPLEFPLVGPFNKSSHGCYCYLPFPYRERLKITLSGKPLFYNITYHRYDSPEHMVSWTGTENTSAVMDQWIAVGQDPKPAASNLTVSGNLSVPAGATGTLFQVEGSGAIQSITLDPSPATTNILSNVWIQMNWDGGEPEVDVPLGDFFGSGKDQINVTSLPIGMKESGSWYCYFPMPYWTSAEIRLLNRGSEALSSLPLEVQYSTNTYRPADSGYFHALFREETFGNNGSDFNFITEEGRGHVVGVSLFMESSGAGGYRDMSYLEGDERAYVDGALSPCIQGTGNEDYFNCGWYFNQGSPSLPYHGNPWKDQFNGGGTNYTQAYRMHISDCIPFNESVRFGVEHGSENNAPGIYSSVTYYYKLSGGESGLISCAEVNVGSAASEAAVSYSAEGATSVSNNYYYPGDLDDVPIADEGVAVSNRVSFSFPIPAVNDGILLRRRMDSGVGEQSAEMYVDGEHAGSWVFHDNTFADVDKRWMDDEFVIPYGLTAGKTRLQIELVLPAGLPVWTEYNYRIYAVQPYVESDDLDEDGMEDAWEVAHFGNIRNAVSHEDADADGASNLDEFICLTDPRAGDSFFFLNHTATELFFDAHSNRTYRLMTCSNLIEAGWQDVDVLSGYEGPYVVALESNLNTAVFYRFEVER
jgi:hypothetical protein